MTPPELEPLPDDWGRMLAVVAHPDDLEYGAASAIARWTSEGKQVAYVMVTDGEAGIDGMSPEEAGPLRRHEQVASAALVGVDDVSFLGHPDGVVVPSLELRRDIAREVRRFRPDVVLTLTFDLTFGPAVLNQSDHRAVGLAVLDAVKDAGNRWIFREELSDVPPWTGVRYVYVAGSNQPTHAVDVTDHLDAGIASLRAHEAYLAGLGGDFDVAEFLRGMTAGPGEALGVAHAVAFRRYQLGWD